MKAFFFSACMLMAAGIYSQNDLQRCSMEKNKTIIKISEDPDWQDSIAARRIEAANEDWKICVTGKKLPDFSVTTLNGKKMSPEKLAGNVTVINFWFTTCPPCVAEMPAFNKLAEEYKNRKVKFLGITFDDKETVKKFLARHRFNVTIIPGADSLESLFGILEHPVTLIVDKTGTIRKAIVEFNIGERAVTEAYRKIKAAMDELIDQ